MQLLKFKKGMVYGDAGEWHLMNAALNGGDFTACGISFEGDAEWNCNLVADTKHKGIVTCKDCISVIKFFRNKEIKF